MLLSQTSNSYFVCNDPPTIDRIFARIRNYDGKVSSFVAIVGTQPNRNCYLTGIRDRPQLSAKHSWTAPHEYP